jgi:hypothetical protein
MSATEKLLSNINEYQNLLGFLNEQHPKILDEWKSKCDGLAARSQHQQTQQPPEVNLNGNYRDRIRE